jgi:hypothetical protein
MGFGIQIGIGQFPGNGFQRNLSGYEQYITRKNRLAVGPNGVWCIGRLNGLFTHASKVKREK